MRIVHDDGERLAGVDPFESAGDIDESRHPVPHGFHRNALGQSDTHRRKDVIDIVPPDESRSDRRRAAWGARCEPNAFQRNVHRLRPDIRRPIDGIRPDRRGRCCRHSFSVGVVHIHDGTAGCVKTGEEAELRLKVVFHLVMKIEMILRQIGEDRRAEYAASRPVEGKRV